MAVLRMEIKGEPREIGLPVLVVASLNCLKVLNDFDAALTRETRATLDWFVSDLSFGSLVLQLESHPKSEERNVGLDVAREFVHGLSLIEREGVTPPLLSEAGMQSARRLIKLVGTSGATGLEVSNLTDSVDISAKSAVHIDQLLKIRKRSLGSVEGKIETLSVHGRARVIVYQSRTRKAVTCVFPKDIADTLMQNAKDMLGSRVNITGMVSSNARGEPMRVEVRSIRRLGSRADLPSSADIYGIAPEFTGDMSTDEYIRSIRVG